MLRKYEAQIWLVVCCPGKRTQLRETNMSGLQSCIRKLFIRVSLYRRRLWRIPKTAQFAPRNTAEPRCWYNLPVQMVSLLHKELSSLRADERPPCVRMSIVPRQRVGSGMELAAWVAPQTTRGVGERSLTGPRLLHRKTGAIVLDRAFL